MKILYNMILMLVLSLASLVTFASSEAGDTQPFEFVLATKLSIPIPTNKEVSPYRSPSSPEWDVNTEQSAAQHPAYTAYPYEVGWQDRQPTL